MFITQRLDEEQPMFAAAVPKAAALAARVDELVVIADSVAPSSLPPGARARTFGSQHRAGRGLAFTRALLSELHPRPVLAVAHMVPLYSVLAAPLLRPFRVPVVLWYTHWDNHRVLRLSERVCTAITSVDARSFPFESPKVHGTGHGIDIGQFPCVGATQPHDRFRALVVGRYATTKGLPQTLRALRLCLDQGLEMTLELRGPTMTESEEAHKRELVNLSHELRLGDRVLIGDVVDRAELPSLFATADVAISNHISPDKIVYEAAASCLPILASHPAFDELVEGLEPALLFDHADPASLAERLYALAHTPVEARRKLGRALRRRVAERHSTDSWAEALLTIAHAGSRGASNGAGATRQSLIGRS